MASHALTGARIFDGNRFHENSALVFADGRIEAIVPESQVGDGVNTHQLSGGILAPGFIDVQVNGGGGRLLNDDPTAATMFVIADGHRPYGTTSLLPTLITDAGTAAAAAMEAAAEAVKADHGIAGLHLEGPHLAPARKGTHLADLMRPVLDRDVDGFIAALERIGTLVLTLAAEQVSVAQVRRLSKAGVIVNIGHSDCDVDTANALFDSGARGVTHLFNAMSGLGHRAPGLVGAALDHPDIWGGIIADGHHIHPTTLRIALRAKRGPGRLFFVTDAMSLVGQSQDQLQLNGRTIYRQRTGFCSKLALEDGTLAGSDLDMASAIRFGIQYLDLPADEALRMATADPADFLRLSDRGRLEPGLRADIVHLGEDFHVMTTWRSGSEAGNPES
jgi:N-acetylglucosamine-6-phosphate deacetylase